MFVTVVKLFNAIQQSQAAATVAAEETKASRGSGKPSLPAPSTDKGKGRGKSKDNPIGRSSASELAISAAILAILIDFLQRLWERTISSI